MMMRDQIKGALEAILFVRAEKVHIKELAGIMHIPEDEVKAILDELVQEYNEDRKRGIQIVVDDNEAFMCTKEEYSDILARMNRTVKKRLSGAAMETLAIIAYKQPITRAEIERIRGVKADKIIANLLEKGLIAEAGYKDVPGRPVLYVTTDNFLKIFGLSSLDELPDIEGE
ncbi:condensin subunit ScpB [Thermosyntropha lipolytica DSM 11003]|uniref:Condensin subunit ScpB n=1 Tax=Thermosyntropha lipolytica DSM 11003 TaxID=1123382 RepID=A0A1M5P8A7_9FIRM|nr:SMC-Scp complex subunit ScpB [Thermosyntropha lipolytica]SHG98071.1 condensin subunit ScpB [Thermosyntropha lipolytica DSM 11003]